jgi:membrane-associated protease RseP (regulator of RpoE activity)
MKLLSTITLVLALGFASGARTADAASKKATFAQGRTSTGWIGFEYWDQKHIFIPADVNGHKTKVLLVTGLPVSNIDKSLAASIGLPTDGKRRAGEKSSDLVHEVTIRIGNLTLHNTDAAIADFTPLASHLGHEVPFMLGDDVFNGLAVDIDFVHQRIEFTDPAHQLKPAGAVEVPLTRVEDIPLIPVSIEGAPPAQFEMGIGNAGDMLIYQPYYEAHKLLESRNLSKRLGIGSGGIVAEPVGVLRRANFAGFAFTDMPAAFIPSALAGTKSDAIAGDLGLPVLARFELIVDYTNNRLYVIPNPNLLHQPFARDRLGLWLNKKDSDLVVEFVSPDSPAQAAGLKVGDRITAINGKPAQVWSETSLADLKYGKDRMQLNFALEDGTVKHATLGSYY